MLGCASAVGMISDLDRLAGGSAGMGGRGVYDERRFSARLSRTVSNEFSRQSWLESTGMVDWRGKRIDDRRLQALLTDRRQ